MRGSKSTSARLDQLGVYSDLSRIFEGNVDSAGLG
jgi:hypothetical protein